MNTRKAVKEAAEEANIKGSGLTNTAKITIWYTMFLVLISGSLMGAIIYVYNHKGGLGEDAELNIFAILLPAILALAAFGGYLITRQSFAPVRKIIETTDEITKDGDLSRRIPIGKSRDEIYDLAKSFNTMFDRLEDMVRREKQFTADASHELRTPIAVIQSQSEYAMEDEDYAAEAVNVINRESRKMSSLITSLLMISRSDAGRMIPDIELTDASELIREILLIKKAAADELHVRIEVNLPEVLDIRTDDEMLARIVVNLVDNALKYGRHPYGTIRISGYLQENDFVLTVSDDGEGIKEEDMERVWERFYQVDESRSGESSSGLGLSIVQSLVNSLGGSAVLLGKEESELGGASFRIRIPADGDIKRQTKQ
ncbi:MAG: HAMP domain-containing histidine kinase [Mogibacterium sp.]|nr:HAMP domain-containing histidine kinase [Mogibacterium sp.]